MATALKLSVSSFKKKKRRTSEASFEKRFATAVLRAGRKSRHPLYSEPGWPDRYINGGAWAELKVLDELSDAHGLRKEQIPNLRERHADGDATFYFAKHEDTLIALRFPEFDTLGLSPMRAKAAGHCYAYDDIDEVVKCLINPTS